MIYAFYDPDEIKNLVKFPILNTARIDESKYVSNEDKVRARLVALSNRVNKFLKRSDGKIVKKGFIFEITNSADLNEFAKILTFKDEMGNSIQFLRTLIDKTTDDTPPDISEAFTQYGTEIERRVVLENKIEDIKQRINKSNIQYNNFIGKNIMGLQDIIESGSSNKEKIQEMRKSMGSFLDDFIDLSDKIKEQLEV